MNQQPQTSRQFSRRTFLRSSALATLGVMGLAACAAPTSPDAAGGESGAPAGEQITLSFIVDTINEGHVKVRDQWAQQFMDEHPNVTVDHQPIPQEYTTKIQTLYAAGTPADIYRYLQEVTPIVTVVEKDMHLQLDDYIARDNYDIADFRPDAIKLYEWEGKIYALPRDYGNQNLFYNKDLLAEAGIEPPTADWTDTEFTFDVFLDMCMKLTKREGDNTSQWGFLVNRGQRPWASWVYSNGGALVHMDDKGVATDCALTDENSVEALQFIQDMMYEHKVAPTPDLESELGGFELFASGKVGIMLTNPSSVSRFRTIETFGWDVATLPIGNSDRRGTGGGGSGWASASGTKHPDEAWQFLSFISSAQAELDEVSVGATTPSRVSVVTSEAFIDPNLPPEHGQGFADAQEYVVRDPVHANWPEITQRIYNPKMDLLWSGTEDAATVAQMIKDEADPLFARA